MAQPAAWEADAAAPNGNSAGDAPQEASRTPDASLQFAVRLGIHGQIGRFSATTPCRRGAQVVCRTVRGVEVGTVLSRLSLTPNGVCDGKILRPMAAEDHLLWNHLKVLADEAFANCQQWLVDQQLTDQLLEVEPLLDGRTIYFHFLQTVSAATSAQVDRLAEIFQQTVASSAFARQVETGCGPGCGTNQAKGCGSACSVCQVRCR